MDERLDRQLRIEGWDQTAIDESRIGVCGDLDSLASQYVLSSSALGFKDIVVIAPTIDARLIETAAAVNPELRLVHLEGNYTSPLLDNCLEGCDLIADLTHYSLANKLLIEKGFSEEIPILRGRTDEAGLDIFTYMRGREWKELETMISEQSFPRQHFDDPVLDTIASGIMLEETKNLVMGKGASDQIITYRRQKPVEQSSDKRILVVGAGALGNFAGLCLAYSGYHDITFMDPDKAELTNLNRQVFLYDGVDQHKAETLSRRLNGFFGISTQAKPEYFRESTPLEDYDAVFDCVDNFETRVVLSDRCKESGIVLVSGGTNVDAGQVIVYDPATDIQTPADFLGLHALVDQKREYERARASCTYRPDPSVIMTNQIIAGFMVDAYRRLMSGDNMQSLFYDSNSPSRI